MLPTQITPSTFIVLYDRIARQQNTTKHNTHYSFLPQNLLHTCHTMN